MTNKPVPCNFGSRLTNTAGSAVPLVLMFSLVDIHPPLPRQRRIAADCSSFSSCSVLLFRCFDLQVYDGENTSSRLLGNFTRDDMLGHVINSTSNRLWLEFNSNASGTNQGFRLTYTSEFVGPITLDQLIQVSFAIMLGFLTMIYSSVRKKQKHPSCFSLWHTQKKQLRGSSWKSLWWDVLNGELECMQVGLKCPPGSTFCLSCLQTFKATLPLPAH